MCILGRVRQMFEERRSTHSLSSSTSSMNSSKSMMSESKSMGWDRSYPLDPLKPKAGATKAVKPPAQRASSLQGSNISMRPAARPAREPLQDSSNGTSAFGKLSNVGVLRNSVATEAEINQQQQLQVMSKKPVVKALAEPKIKVAPLKRAEVSFKVIRHKWQRETPVLKKFLSWNKIS